MFISDGLSLYFSKIPRGRPIEGTGLTGGREQGGQWMVTAVLDLSLCWGSRPRSSKHTGAAGWSRQQWLVMGT